MEKSNVLFPHLLVLSVIRLLAESRTQLVMAPQHEQVHPNPAHSSPPRGFDRSHHRVPTMSRRMMWR